MLRAIDMGWFILDKYYTMTESVPVYAAATLLDPSKRYAWIQKNWPETWWNNAVAGARNIWINEYRDIKIPVQEPTASTATSRKPRQPLDPTFEDIRSSLQVAKATVSADADDFDTFINADAVLIDEGLTALEWWCKEFQRARYPRLSRMAIEILSIPPESADVERAFSGGRRTLSWDRLSMTVESLERVECVGNWQAEGIVVPQSSGGTGIILTHTDTDEYGDTDMLGSEFEGMNDPELLDF